MNLKSQLKLFMEHTELSATELSKRSGVSKQVISLWLSGGSPRKIEQVKKVAMALGTSVDNLCFGNSIKASPAPSEIKGDEWLSGIFEIRVRKLSK